MRRKPPKEGYSQHALMVYKQAPSDGFRVHPAKPVAVLPWRYPRISIA